MLPSIPCPGSVTLAQKNTKKSPKKPRAEILPSSFVIFSFCKLPLMSKPLEIFRAGKHRAMSGQTFEFSEATAREIADGYDPELHEAPIVIGHPKTDDPAYGWIKTIDYVDSKILAEPHQVDAKFADIVNDGKYKKISASFFAPQNTNNPTPGKFYLRHVGFLGAKAPAVKGLKTASFSEDEEDILTFEFADSNEGAYRDRSIKNILRRLRDWLIEKHGQETADSTIPSYELEYIGESAAREQDSLFADPTDPAAKKDPKPKQISEEALEMADKTQAELDKQKAELEAREAQLKKDEAAFSEKEQQATHAANTDFVDTLVEAGRLAPGKKDGVVAFMDRLSVDEEVSFADGEDKQTDLDFFKGLLDSAGEVIDLSEHSATEAGPASDEAEFASGDNEEVDQGRMDLHRKAVALSQKEDITYDQAVDRLAP